MNTGELNELLVKLRLIQLRDSKKGVAVIDNGKVITSVGFGNTEYRSLPAGTDLTKMSEAALVRLAHSVGIEKAGVFDKADVYINGAGYSVKSLETAPPALVNHTARPGWERICAVLGVDIAPLDEMIAEYWKLRKSGVLKEDVVNTDPNSPFAKNKEYLRPILNYFLFSGSGSKDSKHPAEYIFEFSDPLDTSTWSVGKDQYLNRHWDNLVFSLRSSKGMGNYPNIADAGKKRSMAKWTEFWQGGHKGALHVRVK